MANTQINIKKLAKIPRVIKKDLEKKLRKAKRKWDKPAIKTAIELIDTKIGKGISPVEAGGAQTGRKARFIKYSESYQKQIKRRKFPGKKLRPVNLKLSGKMRASLRGRKTKEGIFLFYKDPLADVHTNEGAGRSRVIRRMLPGEGTNEKLSRTITQPLVELFVKILRQL